MVVTAHHPILNFLCGVFEIRKVSEIKFFFILRESVMRELPFVLRSTQNSCCSANIHFISYMCEDLAHPSRKVCMADNGDF